MVEGTGDLHLPNRIEMWEMRFAVVAKTFSEYHSWKCQMHGTFRRPAAGRPIEEVERSNNESRRSCQTEQFFSLRAGAGRQRPKFSRPGVEKDGLVGPLLTEPR